MDEAGKAGFEPLEVTAADAGSVSWNVFGWEYSLMNLCTRPRAKRIARRLGIYLSRAMAPVERIRSLATSYTAVFRLAK